LGHLFGRIELIFFCISQLEILLELESLELWIKRPLLIATWNNIFINWWRKKMFNSKCFFTTLNCFVPYQFNSVSGRGWENPNTILLCRIRVREVRTRNISGRFRYLVLATTLLAVVVVLMQDKAWKVKFQIAIRKETILQ